MNAVVSENYKLKNLLTKVKKVWTFSPILFFNLEYSLFFNLDPLFSYHFKTAR